MFVVEPTYFYFLLTLPFALIWTVLYVFNKQTRKEQLTLSIIGAFAGPVSEVFYFKDYWLPQSVFPMHIGDFLLLPEDIVFGFAIMGIAAVIFEVVFRTRQRTLRSHVNRTYTSVGILSVFIVTLFCSLWFGINSIYASAIAFVAAAIPMLVLRRDLLVDSFGSGIGVTLVMFVSYLAVFNLTVNIEELMRMGWFLYGTPLDTRFVGIPVTELTWGFTMGFLTGPLYEFVRNKRLV